jgi:hypothetical protein
MMQYVRYLPIILELFKKGKDAKEVLQNIGKSDKKLSDLKYLAEFGSDASKTIQDLFTDTEEDRQKYPQELFNTKFGEYLNSVEQRSKKDYKNAVKTLVGVGLAGYMLSPLGKKYPVPEVILADKKEPPQPEQTTIDIVPPELPPPTEQMRAKEGETIIPPLSPKQQKAKEEKERQDRAFEKRFKTRLRMEPEAPEAPQAPELQPQLPPPQERSVKPDEVIIPPITPQIRGAIKRFEKGQRLPPEMAQGPTSSQAERQPSAISPQPQPSTPKPSTPQPLAISPQPSAPVPQTGSQPILFETETYKQMPGPGNAIRQLVLKGYKQKPIEKFVVSNLKKYAQSFEIETGKSIRQEIRDLIANKDNLKAPPKPKQLFTSKEDKAIQDAGLKPKLTPIRKEEMGDFMKQVQESDRPTEYFTAPTDRQAYMDGVLEFYRKLGDS